VSLRFAQLRDEAGNVRRTPLVVRGCDRQGEYGFVLCRMVASAVS